MHTDVQPPGAERRINRRSDSSDEGAERLAEIAEILAQGLIRLRARQSTELSADLGESRLDFSPGRSGHGRRTNGREARR